MFFPREVLVVEQGDDGAFEAPDEVTDAQVPARWALEHFLWYRIGAAHPAPRQRAQDLGAGGEVG